MLIHLHLHAQCYALTQTWMKFIHLHMVVPHFRKTFLIPELIYCKPLAGTKLLCTILWQSCKLCLNSCYKLLVGARTWSSEICLERHIHPKLLTLTSGGTLAIFTLFGRPLKLLYSPSKWQGISITHPHASAGFHFTRKLALLCINCLVVISVTSMYALSSKKSSQSNTQ
jgi:hypothetical protein